MAVPIWEETINEMLRRKQQEKAAAEAQGIGEAQRRGLVGQRGTSDIEMSLRAAKTAPIEQAYTTNIANLLGQQAQQGQQQTWQSGENTAARNAAQWEAERQRQAASTQQLTQQDWAARQADIERNWQTELALRQKGWTDEMIRKWRQDWWKQPVGQVAGTVAGNVITGGV